MSTWEAALLEHHEVGSLISIGRQRRLVLDNGHGQKRVDLCWVDEVVLALIAMAEARDLGITILYPAPAGEVAVLLAAQLLLHQFVHGNRESSVGIVTADTAMATRTWNALRIATTGAREPISEVFPAYRAGPEGESPAGGRRLQGAIIGQQCKGWPVDHLVVDHLAGFVRIDSAQPSIEVFADPIDPGIRRADESGRLIWGWSDSSLADANNLEVRADHTLPFSVASDRLEAMAVGIEVCLRVARHPQAEAAVSRVREDLRLLRSMSPDRGDRNLERGLSAAWHHLATLTSLPCTPSYFDRFAGLPPMAARATRTFAPELSVWANTLAGDIAEIANILSSDIADLRAALDLGNPFERTLREVHASGDETLVITRTGTAAKALQNLLDIHPVLNGRADSFFIQRIGKLHRQGTWARALMIGEPSPWDWHRLLCGLTPRLEILSLGEQSARGCAASIANIGSARDHWGGGDVRERTWRALVGSAPPSLPASTSANRPVVHIVDGAEYVAVPDPFGELASLFDLDPLDIGGEGLSTAVARQDESGEWTAAVPAVALRTDRGRLLLEVGRSVDVRVGPVISEHRSETIEPGAIVLVGRRQRRVGLLEALEERLGDRPDLLAARFLVDHYRNTVRSRFAASGLTVAALHRELLRRRVHKTSAAVRSWVTEATMAPQHVDDLEKLNDALELGFSMLQIRELFAGVQRRRGFRRAAGRALAAAARGSTVVSDENRVDAGTGLSIADLREAVIEAIVIDVARCEEPVPIALLDRLEDL